MEPEKPTLKVRILQRSLTHSGTVYPNGSEAELPESTAKQLSSAGIVEILSTIVEPVENLAEAKGEAVPDPAPQETQAQAEEEAPKATKKTSKRRIDSDDE